MLPTIAACLLGLAALGGLFLGWARMQGGNPPLQIAIVHGILAASGLIALALAVVVTGNRGTLLVALLVLGGAAGLGVAMMRRHLRGELIPIGGLFLHGLFVLLGGSALLAYFVG